MQVETDSVSRVQNKNARQIKIFIKLLDFWLNILYLCRRNIESIKDGQAQKSNKRGVGRERHQANLVGGKTRKKFLHRQFLCL